MYVKMGLTFSVFAIGGPAAMYYLTPGPDELFQKFSPELQASNLANRDRRQRDYEDFVSKLKEYSKSDKHIWEAAAEAQEKARRDIELRARQEEEAKRSIKEGIRAEVAREGQR
jgi:hypothetical protein